MERLSWIRSRLSVSVLLALGIFVLTATVAFAFLYSAPYTVTNNSSTSYPMIGVIGTNNNTFLAANGFIQPDALDTRVETLGGSAKPHMVSDTRTLVAIPSAAGSQTNLRYTMGNSDLASMAIITGYGGYVTIADNVTEPTDNWSVEAFSYLITSTSTLSLGDFTTYTEVDASDNITTPNALRINGANITTNQDYYRYKDMGAGFYPVSFNATGEIYTQGVVGSSQRVGVAWTNTVNDITGFAATDLYLVSAAVNGSTYTIRLGRGNTVAEDTSGDISANTTVYWSTNRTGDTVTAFLYANPAKTVLIDTLNLAGLGAATTYQYQFGLVNYNSGGAGLLWTGYIANDTQYLLKKDGIVDIYPVNNGLALQAVSNPFRTLFHPVASGFTRWNVTANSSTIGLTTGGAYTTNTTVTTANTSGNWTLFQNIPYSDNISFFVGGNRQFYFSPNTIIQGPALPDRETTGGLNNGVITWGSNPTNVSVAIASLVSSAQSVTGTTTTPAPRDVLPVNPSTNQFGDGTVSGNALTSPFRPFVTMISDNSSLTELQSWRWCGFGLWIIMTVWVLRSVGKHQLITGVVSGAILILLVIWNYNIFPIYLVPAAILLFVAGIFAERSPVL